MRSWAGLNCVLTINVKSLSSTQFIINVKYLSSAQFVFRMTFISFILFEMLPLQRTTIVIKKEVDIAVTKWKILRA